MPVIFENPGVLDERTLFTMGINVKENPDAIGTFGTGLKYALSIILRMGGRIIIQPGDGTTLSLAEMIVAAAADAPPDDIAPLTKLKSLPKAGPVAAGDAKIPVAAGGAQIAVGDLVLDEQSHEVTRSGVQIGRAHV